MKVCDLRILSVENPMGIDRTPYFSYIITSEKQNVRQVRYHIVVKDEERVVWQNSQETEQSTFIPYGGELKSRTRYRVEITVWDNHGESDTVSGSFETAFLSVMEWRAQWVKSSLAVFSAEKGHGKQPPATMFRKRFSCKDDIRSARLYATCHGVYISELNGERISGAAFAPEHTSYEKVLCYQTYDVTNFLKKGGNELSLYVGDGWYLGVKTQPRVTNYERRHAVLFQLEITYPGGETETVVSDDCVQCAYGNVRSSDLFAGELYDANLIFGDWQNGEIADYGYGNLIAQYDRAVVCCEEVPVKEIIVTPKGETVLDFGKVLAGRIRAAIDEPKGAVVTFTHTEILDKDGNFFQSAEMPDGGVEQCDRFISAGTKCVYEPFFTYHGFRYVLVEGVTKINKDDFTARVYTTQKENVGSFCCSDERLNKLYANIRNSQSSNLLSIPTDCPQREKAGWTGDIGIYARTALLNEDVTAFLDRWLLSVRADQGKNGAVPIVVPYDGGYPMSEQFFGPMYDEKGTIGSSGWGDACVLVPWAMYCVTGNKKVIADNLDVMEKWCAYILERCKLPCKTKKILPDFDRYLWNRGYHQGDWLVPSLSKKKIVDPIGDQLKQMDFTAQYAAPLYALHTFDLMAEMTQAIDETEKSAKYREIAARMKNAVQNALFDENGDLPTDLMGAYVMAVAFDAVPPAQEKHVAEKLVRLISENGGRLDTGFLSTPFLLDALCKIGRRDLSYALLFQTDCPGWLYEVERGATAIWESWESFEPDGNPKKISFNHYAFGCVDDWVFRNVCGIVPTSPGFKTFRVQPTCDTLSFARRSFCSAYGKIAVEWQRLDSRFTLTCEVPCNTLAEIVLPGGKSFSVGSGRYVFSEEITK